MDPIDIKPPRQVPGSSSGRRATSGAWLMLVVIAAFAAFALLRQLG